MQMQCSNLKLIGNKLIDNYYSWFKVLHIFAVISWMGRFIKFTKNLCISHCVSKDSEADKIFQMMEYHLLKIIMNQAMIIDFYFWFNQCSFIWLCCFRAYDFIMTVVLGLSCIHGITGKMEKRFCLWYEQTFRKILSHY